MTATGRVDRASGRAAPSRGCVASALVLLALAGASAIAACAPRRDETPAAAPAAAPPDTLPPLDHPPLAPPLRITSTFGEYRRGHFHAGLDFSTDRQVGLPVYAPVSGYVERVRTSGTGFGRSLMVRATDRRTILLAHLDAFEGAIASFVAAVQDSLGQYEQDLTPTPGQLPVRAGERIAWTGGSGVGPPHLHMEVRHGDMAYNPLRFGLTLADSVPPELERVVLEPVDDTSYVAGSAAPRRFGWPADTVVIEGRVRAWVDANDRLRDGWARLAPYSVAMEWNGTSVECRFDRIAWDDDMTAVEWVYDGNARVSSGQPLGLWTVPEYRPAMFIATPATAEAGVIAVLSGDPPRVLRLRARDAAGNTAERQLVLRPPRADERGPRASPPRRRARASGRFDLRPVQGEFVRIGFSGAGSRDVRLGFAADSLALRRASFDGVRWWAVVRVPPRTAAVVASGRSAAGAWEQRRPLRLTALTPSASALVTATRDSVAWRWSLPPRGVFAPTFVFDSLEAGPSVLGLAAAVDASWRLGPAMVPMRRGATITASVAGSAPERAGLFLERTSGWARASAPDDEVEVGALRSPRPVARSLEGEVRGLGRVAVLADVAPPRVGPARVMRLRTGAPNRWALQSRASDRGSGLDPARTHFLVDGRRVPTEWDPENGLLSWRPLQRPPSGSHRYEIVAVDHFGQETRQSGGFVVP